MKKALLLSVVASTMIMAGGDIAPVEPVVEAAPVETWNFSGQAVAYTQTRDSLGGNQGGDLFGGATTAGALGLQLRATHNDLFAGIGFGGEISSIAAGHNNGYSNSHFGMQDGDALTQAYFTYGMDSINTSLKLGRQTLPKSLSPFAFSEGWNVFKNTFDAALLVNTSLSNTALVYAFVAGGNGTVTPLPGSALHPWAAIQGGYSDLADFNEINDDGVHMLTIQNTSINNLTLTGTWYYGADHTAWLSDNIAALSGINGGDTNVLWGDATYKGDAFTLGVQGGQIDPDGLESTSGWGAKIAGNLGMFGLAAAYTSVDDGTVKMANFGTSVKTPLYTQSILDQDTIAKDSDTFKLSATMKALGGGFGLHYINSDLGAAAPAAVMYPGFAGGAGTYEEIDFTYKTKVGENITLFAAYVYQNDDRVSNVDLTNPDNYAVEEQQDFLRFWARYNF